MGSLKTKVRRWLPILAVLVLAAGLWPSPSTAQIKILESLYLQEYGLYSRPGAWSIYSFPGSPFGFNLGGTFAVAQVCQPSGSGGVFLSAGQGFGDLAFVSPWPFTPGTTLGFDTSGNPLNLCDPNADESWWFLYGSSLNKFPGGTTGGIGRFSGNDDVILDVACSTQPTPTEGIFFYARPSADRQTFDAFCNQQTSGGQPLRAGNVLICRFPRGATWVTPQGVPTGIHLRPLFGLETCEWYAACSANPIGGVVPRSGCVGLGGGGGGTGTVVVTALNGNNSNPVQGASVGFPGGPTVTTSSSGQATFTGVPAGGSVTFTASANGFGSATGSVTPVAGQTVNLTIKLPVVVTCSDFSHDGGNAGDVQIVDLHKTPATFKFDWDTYTVPDRIVVSHDGTTLFDSSCVGANGSQTLSYSGGSTGVRVQVFPDCQNQGSTGWTYTVHCPVP